MSVVWFRRNWDQLCAAGGIGITPFVRGSEGGLGWRTIDAINYGLQFYNDDQVEALGFTVDQLNTDISYLVVSASCTL